MTEDIAGARVSSLVDALFETTGRTQDIYLLCGEQDGKSYRNLHITETMDRPNLAERCTFERMQEVLVDYSIGE